MTNMSKKHTILLALCLLAVGAKAQVQRTSVLEEFSTANCQYCPRGYAIIKQAIDSHPGTIWLVHHSGFIADAITIPASERLTFLYGTNSFAPAYMIDRTVPSETYTAYSPVWPVEDSARVASQLDEMAAKPCFTTVAIDNLNFDAATRSVTATISGQISGEFDADITHITVYLVEDSIVLPQASTTGTIEDYIHLHAVRDCATDIFGDPLSFAADGSYSYSLNYTLPTKAVASHCRLVALVHYYKATNLTLNSVLNATATNGYLCASNAAIGRHDDIGCKVFPNPANDFVVIETTSNIRQITISDLKGNTLLRDETCNGSAYRIDTRHWAKGIYLISIVADNGITTQKMVINK